MLVVFSADNGYYAGSRQFAGKWSHYEESLRVPEAWRTDFLCEHLLEQPSIPKWEGVRDRRWMYARYFEQEPVYEFLHDLEVDPDELRNLAQEPSHAVQLERMLRRSDDLRDRYGVSHEPLGPDSVRPGAQ